jgi:hypothetical protein
MEEVQPLFAGPSFFPASFYQAIFLPVPRFSPHSYLSGGHSLALTLWES